MCVAITVVLWELYIISKRMRGEKAEETVCKSKEGGKGLAMWGTVMCCQHSYTIGNVKGSSGDWRELTPDRNLDLQEGMRSTTNCNYASKYKRLLLKKDVAVYSKRHNTIVGFTT